MNASRASTLPPACAALWDGSGTKPPPAESVASTASAPAPSSGRGTKNHPESRPPGSRLNDPVERGRFFRWVAPRGGGGGEAEAGPAAATAAGSLPRGFETPAEEIIAPVQPGGQGRWGGGHQWLLKCPCANLRRRRKRPNCARTWVWDGGSGCVWVQPGAGVWRGGRAGRNPPAAGSRAGLFRQRAGLRGGRKCVCVGVTASAPAKKIPCLPPNHETPEKTNRKTKTTTVLALSRGTTRDAGGDRGSQAPHHGCFQAPFK